MSIEGFDFDVNNYDRTELLEILKLSDEVNINPTEVRVAAANMLSSLSNDKNLQEREKIKNSNDIRFTIRGTEYIQK
mgnify:CR=1 FL=1